MYNRRDLIKGAASAGAILALSPAYTQAADTPKALRILILGGTGFIGPHHVNAAVTRGHRVSVFNRGISRADLPKGVEVLVGDRNGDLEAIKGRDWDAVIDLPTYGPQWVRSLGRALSGRVGHYTFISSNAVYESPSASRPTTEDSRLLEYRGKADPYSDTANTEEYGALKVLCEREAERQFPGRALILRPGWIFGPGSLSSPITYWPVRIKAGGDVVVAGESTYPVQFTDVRDLAEWAIRMIERRATGVFNAIGPVAPTTLGQLLDSARAVVSEKPRFTWLPPAWIASQSPQTYWSNLLFWTFEPSGYAAMMRMSNDRAIANGFSSRPLAATVEDSYAWYCDQPPVMRSNLLIQRIHSEASESDKWVPVAWESYIAAEDKILSKWRALAKH